MKIRRMMLCMAAAASITALIVLIMLPRTPNPQLCSVAVNDIIKTLSAHWTDIQSGGTLPASAPPLHYTVIDTNGNFIAATRPGLSQNINQAIQNRDTIVDIVAADEIVGKAIFYNDTAQLLRQNKIQTLYIAISFFAILLILFAIDIIYLHFTVIRPFQKLKAYAGQIAAGNLDLPLEMDKNNLFGAFTMSFDLMREELNKAKENERRADLSKKELVASLSHDIKTPVASIKAVIEYMMLVAANDEDRKQLMVINVKADQINTLITDMFHSTLEELQMLRVTVSEVQSTALAGLIRIADYKGLIQPFSIPSCIISADLQRLQQVFDNIISNSYKYAGTKIEIAAAFENESLVITILDLGPGVSQDELPLLFNKFYRGQSSNDKNGYGLGLFISRYLMEQMSGGIRCENLAQGFAVKLSLHLS